MLHMLLVLILCGASVPLCDALTATQQQQQQQQQQFVCDVTAFGAVGDNKTSDTAAVQRALRSCHALRPAAAPVQVTVRFPAPGRYLIGPVNVSSYTTVFVEDGATIVGSPHRADYPRGEPVYGRDPEYLPLIGSWDSINVIITGSNGTIDGNGWAGGWYFNRWKLKGWEKGPRLIGMFRVRGLEIGNLTLRDGARWHVHPVWCRDVRVHDLYIFAPREHAGEGRVPRPPASGLESSF
jgi:polygalacturonase